MASPSDKDEFRRALGDVEPLPKSKRADLHRPRPKPYPRPTKPDERAALAESLGPVSLDDPIESGEELTFLRDGYPPDILRKLRRGNWVIEDYLDLHGMNRITAAIAVNEFLRTALARRMRCVRIIHGRGLGSHNREPVLKGLLRGWLTGRQEVLAFSQAPAAQGGGGALLVLLRT